MSRVKSTKNKLKSKLEVIKKINDDPKKTTDELYDLYLKDLPSTDQIFGKKFGDLLEKRKRKKENNNDIFSELIDVAESFFGTNKTIGDSNKIFSKNRLRKFAQDSTKITLQSSKQIILDTTKSIFFVGEGICGADSTITDDIVNIKPSEFDFLNVLTIDPSSTTGQIVYENSNQNTGKEKVNINLFQSFSGSDYDFNTINNNTLFTIHWDSSLQLFNISGLTQSASTKVEDFLNDYYSSVEFPDITGITKNAMLLTLQGSDGDNPLFQGSLNSLNRLLSKLFAICGSSKQNVDPLRQNPNDQFNENDEDVEFYFNFNDVEGIDLDDEDARLRKVLKFRDCNNFEIPTDNSIVEDFVYFTKKKSLDDLVVSTLTNVSNYASDNSNSSIPTINFNLSIMNTYILNLPKALIMSLLSPKIFLPIVVVYKLFKSGINSLTDVKDLMKKLSKLFWTIVKKLFWKFLREFWKFIKRDLLAFISLIAQKVLKNKYKRYITIITSLIALLKRMLVERIDNCYDLFNTILNTVNNSLRGGRATSVPALLLSFSNQLPGYSTDRAYMNICERLEAQGISLAPIYGEANKLPSMIKSIIDGHTEEEDVNGFIAGGNQFFTVPSSGGPIVFPPGIIRVFGKKR